ncbi:MAG: hypothetical protein LRY36_00720 [Alphaproteobacteria bacterium]|nr:hypothetical protein [Alphaproteobacteria bacterium]
MGIKSLFNTLVKGKEEMLRIDTPLTLTLDGAGAVLSLAGLAAMQPAVISMGISFITISATLSYLLGAKHNRNNPNSDNSGPRP